MKLKIEIKMDGAAFTEDGEPEVEAGRILAEFAIQFASNPTATDGWETALRDINGNVVGKAQVVR